MILTNIINTNVTSTCFQTSRVRINEHGCFRWYLHNIARRKPTVTRHEYGMAKDTARYILYECVAWSKPSLGLEAAAVGPDLSLPGVVKVSAERGRKTDTHGHFLRRRRPDARRGRYDFALSLP